MGACVVSHHASLHAFSITDKACPFPLRYVGLLLLAGHNAFAMNACPVRIWPVSEDVNDGPPLFSRQNKVNDGEEGASGITASPDCQSGKRWIYAFISAMSLISESKRVTFSRETLCFFQGVLISLK